MLKVFFVLFSTVFRTTRLSEVVYLKNNTMHINEQRRVCNFPFSRPGNSTWKRFFIVSSELYPPFAFSLFSLGFNLTPFQLLGEIFLSAGFSYKCKFFLHIQFLFSLSPTRFRQFSSPDVMSPRYSFFLSVPKDSSTSQPILYNPCEFHSTLHCPATPTSKIILYSIFFCFFAHFL